MQKTGTWNPGEPLPIWVLVGPMAWVSVKQLSSMFLPREMVKALSLVVEHMVGIQKVPSLIPAAEDIQANDYGEYHKQRKPSRAADSDLHGPRGSFTIRQLSVHFCFDWYTTFHEHTSYIHARAASHWLSTYSVCTVWFMLRKIQNVFLELPGAYGSPGAPHLSRQR